MGRRVLDYESRKQPLATRLRFFRRLGLSIGVALVILCGSLLAGMVGHAHFEGMSWLDAFHNAALVLSGIGPVEQSKTAAGKFFVGCYAIYAQLIVVLVSGIVLAPIAHRILHRFHIGG